MRLLLIHLFVFIAVLHTSLANGIRDDFKRFLRPSDKLIPTCKDPKELECTLMACAPGEPGYQPVMVFTSIAEAESRCRDLEFQLQMYKRLNRSNVKLIEEQYKMIQFQTETIDQLNTKGEHSKMIQLQSETIDQLNTKVEQLEDSLDRKTKECVMFCKAAVKYLAKMGSMRLKKERAVGEVEDMELRIEQLNLTILSQAALLSRYTITREDLAEQHEAERQQSITVMGKDFVNFPKNLLVEFENQSRDPYSENSIPDDLFQKELAKRLRCKICLCDIERHRCSKCLKGICKDCNSKVKKCPHCRCERNKFHPIIMSRI